MTEFERLRDIFAGRLKKTLEAQFASVVSLFCFPPPPHPKESLKGILEPNMKKLSSFVERHRFH